MGKSILTLQHNRGNKSPFPLFSSRGKKRPVFVCFGARRKIRTFFLDLDTKDIDVYETRHGIHLVANSKHKYDYHGRRLRISPKWDLKGRTISRAPKLLFCNCKGKHHDKRLKRRKAVIYITRSS